MSGFMTMVARSSCHESWPLAKPEHFDPANWP
jgi:hypothetical protein